MNDKEEKKKEREKGKEKKKKEKILTWNINKFDFITWEWSTNMSRFIITKKGES